MTEILGETRAHNAALIVTSATSLGFGGEALACSTTGMTIAVVPLELSMNDLGGRTGLVIFLAIFVGFLCQPIAWRMKNTQSLAQLLIHNLLLGVTACGSLR